MEDNSKTNLDNRPLYLILGILLVFTALAAIVLSSLRTTAATDFSDDVSITVQSSCTLGGTVDTAHATNLQLDTFSGDDGIGQTTLTAFCNDYNGFSIYAIGYTGNTYGNTNLVGTNTSLTIPTGVYTDGDTTSKWAMKVNKVNDSTAYNPANMSITNSYDSWHVVPSSYAQVAEYHANTGASHTDATLGGKITTTYAAYSSAGQTADTYEGQVKYTIVHPYNAAAPTPLATMQAFAAGTASTTCSAMSVGDTIDLDDARDGKDYTIAKLADGKCWMVDNLNLAGGTKLDSEKSDVPAGYTQSNPYFTLPASSTEGFSDNTVAYVYNSNNNTTKCTSTRSCNSYYSWLTATAGGKNADGESITGDGYNATYSICPKGWKLPTATTEGVSRVSGGYTGGDFYKMAIQYGMIVDSFYESPDNVPTFYSMAGLGTIPSFLPAGNHVAAGLINGGVGGRYWSATSTSSTYAYDLFFDSSAVYSADSSRRSLGYSVRCLLRDQ
ncbi:hypothetical protein IKG60_00135 [Candidatus Saccharibacteria bacterium]|nr:hypothetical protein [Candidatus Saccharibacteria bacterium]